MAKSVIVAFLTFFLGCAGPSQREGLDLGADESPETMLDAVDAVDTAEQGPDIFDAPTDLQYDEVTEDISGPKEYVSARRTALPQDLVGGDNAYGILGKSFILENDLVRFLIQDAGTAVHLGVYGGTLIDADVRRQPGNDQFRELFPVVGFRVTKVTKVEVVKDGSDGLEAIVRVSGKDATTGISKYIDALGKPLDVTIETDFILKPNVPFLTIRTRVYNEADQPLENLAVGDFVAFGGATKFFTEEGGFSGKAIQVAALVGAGRGASYGYTVASGEIFCPYQENNATLALLGTDFRVPAKGSASFDRYFIVGNGDVASVLRTVHEIRGEEVVTARGKVLSEAAEPIPGALVTAFLAGQGVPGKGRAVNQAATDKNGVFEMTLRPGAYDFVASAPGRRRVTRQSVDPSKVFVEVQMGAQGRLGLDITEKDTQGKDLGHVPAKVSLYCLGDSEPPWDELNEGERYGLCAVLYQIHGEEIYPVKPGRYKALISRGIEYELETIEELEVKPGQITWVEKAIVRTVDTKGWLSADLHQHTFGSIDSELSHTEKVIENLAEGVEIAATTDHDNFTSYEMAIKNLGVEDLITSINGNEVSASGRGHFNIFAPTGKSEELDPYRGAQLYAFRTIPELFEVLRSIPGVRLIQVNHPRDGLDAYFSFARFDPVEGFAYGTEEIMTMDFDIVEVKDSLGSPEQFLPEADAQISEQAKWGSQDIPVLRDFFGLLGMGKTVCAVGVSDAHDRNDGVGYSRTYLYLGTDDPSKVSTDQIVEALKAQKAIVSNGPFIRLRVGEKSPLGHTEPVEIVQGEPLVINVQVLAASWINVTRLEVYANGRPLRLMEVAGTLFEIENPKSGDPLFVPIPLPNTTPTEIERLNTTVNLFPKQDTWYVFVVKGEGGLEPVGDGKPFAYTNPLYVKVVAQAP